MNNKNKFAVLIILTFIYDRIFWYDKAGINLLIFLILTVTALLYYNKDSIFSIKTWILAAAALYSTAMIIINNSAYSIIAYVFSILILTGFVHQTELRTLYGSLLTSVSSFFLFPYNMIKGMQKLKKRSRSFAISFRILRLAMIPLFIVFLFHSIYASANPIYNTYTLSVQDFIYNNLEKVFYMFTAERILFLLSGMILIMGILYNINISFFKNTEKQFLNTLKRDKAYKIYSRIKVQTNEPNNSRFRIFKFKINSLHNENKTGLILIALVNLLLLALNIIDIQFTWLNFDPGTIDNMAYYVHDGTYLLILSIVMSMLIVLYYFRGNQNFYSKYTILKYGAYLWLFQNGIMAVSLALRNIYYIQYYFALSFKRIGVMVFIILVFAGLVTMFIKLRDKKSLFWLLKVNAAAAFIFLLIMSGINWESKIADFNLSNPKKDSIDYAYLLQLSPQIYPLLDKYQMYMNKNMKFHTGTLNGLHVFISKKEKYLEKIKGYSWLSFNLPDKEYIEYAQ